MDSKNSTSIVSFLFVKKLLLYNIYQNLISEIYDEFNQGWFKASEAFRLIEKEEESESE